jgi:hypothetical protein
VGPSAVPLPKIEFLICKIVLLDFVHRLKNDNLTKQRFGSWILLPSSGKKGGGGERRQRAYLLGPLVELSSDLSTF